MPPDSIESLKQLPYQFIYFGNSGDPFLLLLCLQSLEFLSTSWMQILNYLEVARIIRFPTLYRLLTNPYCSPPYMDSERPNDWCLTLRSQILSV